MSVKAKVTVKQDRVEEVLQAVMAADTYEVLVGFPEETAPRQEGKLTNPQIAYIHNYGAPAANIPQREFMEPGIEAAQPLINQIAAGSIPDAIENGSERIMAALELIGQVAADSVKQKIVEGPFVPLAPATIRRKGSSKPLIDTGQLRQSVTYVVRRKER